MHENRGSEGSIRLVARGVLILRMENQEGHMCLKGHFSREVPAERILKKWAMHGSHRQEICIVLIGTDGQALKHIGMHDVGEENRRCCIQATNR